MQKENDKIDRSEKSQKIFKGSNFLELKDYDRTKIGVIGCGIISKHYLEPAKRFRNIETVACADNFPERAQALAKNFGLTALTIDELLAEPEIKIVLNLTPPKAHAVVTSRILKAGKSVFSEKPLGINLKEAEALIELAKQQGVRIGCAPDIFLGGGQQTARKVIDEGWIGRPLNGTAVVQGRGFEKLPTAPAFVDAGAGPMLDLGPYYITALVNMLGPARSVTAVTRCGIDQRKLGAQVDKAYQDKYHPFSSYPVNVNTHQVGIVEFVNGTVITVIASFDVHKHTHPAIEIYGEEGSIQLPTANTFGGPVMIYKPGYSDWKELPLPFCYSEKSRCIGTADLAAALQSGRAHRANAELAFHVLEIMLAFDKSSTIGQHIEIKSRCERPAPMPLDLIDGEIDG